MSIKAAVDYSLYLVTDRKSLGEKSFIGSIESAVKGGVTLVQLREKSMSSHEYYNT
ncbi:MAG TPA: thiamine phosphate synthase, partial [Negativicutes bacterium]|nr:thiamine phosphate synthase [Negativicutes bacterium]